MCRKCYKQDWLFHIIRGFKDFVHICICIYGGMNTWDTSTGWVLFVLKVKTGVVIVAFKPTLLCIYFANKMRFNLSSVLFARSKFRCIAIFFLWKENLFHLSKGQGIFFLCRCLTVFHLKKKKKSALGTFGRGSFGSLGPLHLSSVKKPF